MVDLHRCPGRMRNGPGKRYVRCNVCGRVDWERNEGDPCPYPAPSPLPSKARKESR